MSVNQQSDFGVQLAESREGGKRHGNQIAHTADIDHDLVRAFIGKPAAQLSNHRCPITGRQYCRFLFARQRVAGIADTGGKKGPLLSSSITAFSSVKRRAPPVSTPPESALRASLCLSHCFSISRITKNRQPYRVGRTSLNH